MLPAIRACALVTPAIMSHCGIKHCFEMQLKRTGCHLCQITGSSQNLNMYTHEAAFHKEDRWKLTQIKETSSLFESGAL